MVTPARRGPTAAPPTVSTRLPVIHGSRDWMQGKSPKDMLICGWFLLGNGDPKHWTHLVWMITDTSPIAMLAADTLANQGAVRKDLGSLTAKGACTHVCMHPDAKTGRPCGHTWYLKPKATAGSKRFLAVDPSFSVFSTVCNHGSGRFKKIGIFPDLNPDLAGIPDFGKSGIPIWPESRIREIGNPDFAGIGKINPDARASGISGSAVKGSLNLPAKNLSHLGRWDGNFPRPTFLEAGGTDFPALIS